MSCIEAENNAQLKICIHTPCVLVFDSLENLFCIQFALTFSVFNTCNEFHNIAVKSLCHSHRMVRDVQKEVNFLEFEFLRKK